MSAPRALGFVEASVRSVLFDLRIISRNPRQWVMIIGLPLLMVGFVGVAGVLPFALFGGEQVANPLGATVYIQADPVHHDSLRAVLERQGRKVRFEPSEQVADVVVVVPPDALTTATFDVQLGPRTPSIQAHLVRSALGDWLVERWTADRIGAAPVLAVEVAETSAETGLRDGAGSVRVGVGVVLIGFFGAGFGLALGPPMVRNAREGFNRVLAIGSPPSAVYLADLVVMAMLQLAQTASWWMVYAFLVGSAGVVTGARLPPAAELVEGLPLVATLGVIALLTGTSASVFAARAGENLPPEIRERGLSLLLGPLILVGMVVWPLLRPTHLIALSLVPVLGPVAVWAISVDGHPATWPLVAVQVGYAVLSLRVGAWALFLDESPFDEVRRRWWR